LKEISHNNNDYVSLLHLMARNFNIHLTENYLRLPEKIGDGFTSAYNLPDGISVQLSDGYLHDGLIMHRLPSSQQFFILQLNDSFDAPDMNDKLTDQQHTFYIQNNKILLTSSQMETRMIFPAKVRSRSVRIIFSSDYLQNLIGHEMADKFLSSYFSLLLKGKSLEILDTEYRVITGDLLKEKPEHPLLHKFIYNRATLLIEKFVTGFMRKLEEQHTQPVKLKEDEINRLIKVETLLVKDFTTEPPVIAALSKVAAMSPTKLKKDFKAMYGLPIYEYYQKNRMMRAKALLLESKYAIKEVGMMVGYSNLGHFAGSFKKEFGILPSELVTGTE